LNGVRVAEGRSQKLKEEVMKNKTAVNLPDSIRQQLNMYALAASAAGVGVLTLTQPLEAKIIYTKAHHSIPSNSSYRLDLNHDKITDFRLDNNYARSMSSQRDSFLARAFQKGNAVIETNNGRFASALSFGKKVDGNGKFAAISVLTMAASYTGIRGSYRFGPWLNVTNRYLGLRFVIKGKTHYGWARLNVNCSGFKCRGLLTGYAYETIPGKGIVTGKTKGSDVVTVQPASLGHLAAGASGIPEWRSGK
jgi:hypothetical protein